MASDFSGLLSVGEVIKSPETECEFEWIFPYYASLMERDEVHFSPTFSFAGIIWRFFIYAFRDYLNAGLIRNSTNPPISLKSTVGFKTLNGKEYREGSAIRSITAKGSEMYTNTSCLHKTELLKRKSDMLPSNDLTVLFVLKSSKAIKDAGGIATSKCSYCKDIVDTKGASSHQNKCLDKPIKCPECSEVVALRNWYEHKCQMVRGKGESCATTSSNVLQGNKVLNDLKEFFLKKEDCDVVMKVQGQEFQAHKALLQARSPVLASTFRNDMKEKATGVVDIEDCDPSSFSDFLYFLYCGEMEIITQANVFNLFTTADKYDVQDLRAQCLEFMKENLSVDTFCDTITLALRHSETELIKLTTDFFTKNAPKIIMTVKWQSFLAENPTESNELLVKLLVSNSSN